MKATLQMALEALEYEARAYAVHSELQIPKTIREAITAIKEALAQQCVCGEPNSAGTHRTDGPCFAPQPEQEPVAWQLLFDDGHTEITTRPVANWKRLMWESAGKRWGTLPLYTTPPQRTWVGLDDIDLAGCSNQDEISSARYWEAKLKEKNA